MLCSKIVSFSCMLGPLVALIICVVPSSEARADVVVHEEGVHGFNIIEVSGYIKTGDSEKLQRSWNYLQTVGVVWLKSPGGDVDEALQMGRFLRAKRARVSVPVDSVCASACVFVLMGATERIFSGSSSKTIIHRPFTTSTDDLSFDVREKNHKKIVEILREYFEEMHFSQELLSQMESVPPESGHVLTNEELSRWGFSTLDPVEQEARDSQGARRFGISMEEYVARKARSSNVCEGENNPYRSNPLSDDALIWHSKCWQDVMTGAR